MSIKKSNLEKARLVKAIIEKEFYENHTVVKLARMVGTNKSTLNLAFREEFGMPLKKFIQEYRMGKVKELLKTELSIEIIAIQIGLDRSNLDKQFKKATGKTPTEWRLNSSSHLENTFNVSE